MPPYICTVTVMLSLFSIQMKQQKPQFVTPNRVIVVTQSIEPYVKKNSCQTTLIKLVEDWKRSLHYQKVLGVLTTDLSKAVDSLHPLLLLAKPSAYGFTDEDIGLLGSYFSEWTNSVRIGTETSSEWKEMFRGCLEGSNFWPPSFNVFQNDLLYNNGKSSIKMYADDHEKYVTRGKMTIKVLDKYAESGPDMKLLCVTFDKH